MNDILNSNDNYMITLAAIATIVTIRAYATNQQLLVSCEKTITVMTYEL